MCPRVRCGHSRTLSNDDVSREIRRFRRGWPRPGADGCNTLLGNDVYDLDGEDLGEIKEFMIDMASGKVAYAVLSFGGILGVGNKLFAVPWRALKLDTANKRFTLDVSKEDLDEAPGFDKDHLSSMADPAWANRIHKFCGTDIVR